MSTVEQPASKTDILHLPNRIKDWFNNRTLLAQEKEQVRKGNRLREVARSLVKNEYVNAFTTFDLDEDNEDALVTPFTYYLLERIHSAAPKALPPIKIQQPIDAGNLQIRALNLASRMLANVIVESIQAEGLINPLVEQVANYLESDQAEVPYAIPSYLGGIKKDDRDNSMAWLKEMYARDLKEAKRLQPVFQHAVYK